jgi:hypothetical protein
MEVFMVGLDVLRRWWASNGTYLLPGGNVARIGTKRARRRIRSIATSPYVVLIESTLSG